jgi:DNA-binding GntR family transcriptional regulator
METKRSQRSLSALCGFVFLCEKRRRIFAGRRQILNTVLLRSPPLHDNVTDALRDLIVSGELLPGTKVREHALCARFGISRTPLREALKVLASEGLVQLMPRRGAFVAEITQTEIDELFPIMAALEALAAEAACRRITEENIRALRELHRQMYAFHAAGAERDYLRLNRQIHLALFEIAGNASLTSIYEQLLVRIHSVRFVARKTPVQWQRAVGEHVLIMAAIERRDGPRLARLLRSHLLKTAVPIARHSLSMKTAAKP